MNKKSNSKQYKTILKKKSFPVYARLKAFKYLYKEEKSNPREKKKLVKIASNLSFNSNIDVNKFYSSLYYFLYENDPELIFFLMKKKRSMEFNKRLLFKALSEKPFSEQRKLFSMKFIYFSIAYEKDFLSSFMSRLYNYFFNESYVKDVEKTLILLRVLFNLAFSINDYLYQSLIKSNNFTRDENKLKSIRDYKISEFYKANSQLFSYLEVLLKRTPHIKDFYRNNGSFRAEMNLNLLSLANHSTLFELNYLSLLIDYRVVAYTIGKEAQNGSIRVSWIKDMINASL